jgi:hypothetical protein
MTAHIPIADLFRVLLPRDSLSGCLAMLTAYFDDSGTHEDSNVVLVGGIVGTEWQLTSLERLWKPHIDRPLCGRKPQLRRFHATECYDSRNEFAGWSRTETDYFFHQLHDVLIASNIGAYGIEVSRRDWDELITGDVRGFLGDAETYAISQCFVCALNWARNTTFDPQITFVFDNRPSEIQRRAQAISDAFTRWSQNPEIVGCSFLSSFKIRPLQAADLFAWEVYQHAKEIFDAGRLLMPSRYELNRLNANISMRTQYANRESIQQIADYIKSQPADYVKAAANHFTHFDPSNPDYSFLAGEQSS